MLMHKVFSLIMNDYVLTAIITARTETRKTTIPINNAQGIIVYLYISRLLKSNVKLLTTFNCYFVRLQTKIGQVHKYSVKKVNDVLLIKKTICLNCSQRSCVCESVKTIAHSKYS